MVEPSLPETKEVKFGEAEVIAERHGLEYTLRAPRGVALKGTNLLDVPERSSGEVVRMRVCDPSAECTLELM